MARALILICQGETTAARAGMFPADDPLTPPATDAAARLAARLPEAEAVIAAPGRAARETAAALGLDHTIEDALRDLDYGRWAGRTLRDIGAAEPDAMAAWLSDPLAAPHGGEGIASLIVRVAAWMEARLADRGRLLAVAPPAVIRAATIHALGAPAEVFQRLDAAPLSLTTLTSDGRRWSLRTFGAPLT